MAGESGQDFGFYPAAQTGDLDVNIKVEAAPFFLAAFLGGVAGGLVCPVLDLADFDDFGGEQPHLLDPANSFILTGNLERALGFLAMGIHGHIAVFGHITCT